MTEIDLNQPDLYINRELSLLQFNRRVLELSQDSNQPLLERLKFLCISCSNLDEFFEVRVAGIKQQLELNASTTSPERMTIREQMRAISEQAHALVAEQYRTLNEIIIPALEVENIRFVRRTHWNEAQAEWLKEHFRQELLPLLSPLGLDPAHPFPKVLNKSLNFIVSLEGKDAFGRDSGMAVVQAPRSMPRLIKLPDEVANTPNDFVFLSSVIHAHVGELFPGMTVKGCYQFRVTRNSELFVEEDEVKDLLVALSGELAYRNYGDAVRLEVADNCPQEMADFLLKHFRLTEEDLYQVHGPVNLNRLMAVHELVDRADLKFPAFTPGYPKGLSSKSNLFEMLDDKQNILLHHPYQSFSPVIDFIHQAAYDPDVRAIKQTLYRSGSDLAIVKSLMHAARSGKEVTVVIELKARFDEEANIRLATMLQDAGAHVVYGVVNHKTHAKMAMVVRRKGQKFIRYCHLSTGNYHTGTARAYTDYGLLTADQTIGEDVNKLFTQLTGLGKATKLKALLQSPFTLHKTLIELIDQEAAFAQEGKAAHIMVKLNALIEPEIIRALYRASQAGVKIELMVRGVCCLKPGIPGVSDNIQVISVMGRFLEHSRIYYFLHNGAEKLYCSSADWMPRNFFRRVEACFPILDAQQKQQVIENDLKLPQTDNTQSWVLQSDGSYQRVILTEGEEAISTHQVLLEKLART